MRFRLRNLVRQVLQLAAAFLVLLSLSCLLLFTVYSFFPSISIPYLSPAQKVTEDTVFYRRSWREPFAYDIKVYASQSKSITVDNAASFFESAQLLWHVPQQSLEKKYSKHSAKVNFKTPESMFGTMRRERDIYAHVFIQKSDQFTPHPNISDPYLVQTSMLIFNVYIDYRYNPRTHSMPNATLYASPFHYFVTYWPSLSWDLVLEDHTYTKETLPKVFRPWINDSPNEGSKTGTYNPPLIYRSAKGYMSIREVETKNTIDLTGSSGQSSSPANTNGALSIDVDFKIQGISQGWVRGEDAIVKLAEPKYDNAKYSSGFLPSDILRNASVLSVILLVVSTPLVVALLLTALGDIAAFWSQVDTKWEGTSRLVVVLGVVYQCGSLAVMYIDYKMYGKENILAYFYAGLSLWVFAALYNIPLNPFKWRQRIASLRAPASSGIPKPVLAGKDDSSSTAIRVGGLPRSRGRDLAASTQQEVDQLFKKWLVWLSTPSLVLCLVYTAATSEGYNHRVRLIDTASNTFYAIRGFQLLPQVVINYRTKSVAWIPITAYMCELLVNIHQILVVWAFRWPMFFSPVPAGTNWVHCFLLAVLAVQWAKYYKAKQD
ncbi:hypothetical protein GQ54DRAFT_319333 [Martensiomyces pterosporus]|nr:hypothetical protein GQ54DRAFT_319333 [Martensiomyces pterosporus]